MKTTLVGNTHLLAGSEADLPLLLKYLAGEGIKPGDPDLYVRTYGHFGIDEARELRERASLRPMGKRRVFVLVAPDLNREAQNALLKTLEEPPADAFFFFVLRSPETLLPTFRSRAQTFSIGSRKRDGSVDAKTFLAATTQKRLDLLKPLLEKGEEGRDIGAILTFLSSLEAIIESRAGIEAVYRARKYITDKGALVKPLLEQVALLVPASKSSR